MLKHPQRHKNLGVTLLELMLSLAVIATVIVAVTYYYSTAREGAKVTQAVSMINNVVSASFTWVGGQPNFGGNPTATPPVPSISLSILVSAQLLPATYTSPTVNPWQGSINVALGTNTNTMIVTLDKVPANSCAALVQKILNVNASTSSCSAKTGLVIYTATFTENPQS